MLKTPLTDRFPGVANLPRVELCDTPTPLEKAWQITERLSEEAGRRLMGGLWVKRDDLTSVAYGGNKSRKLELLLGQALAENRRAVITFGAYGSNHALATAVHATALGLEPHVVLSPQAPGPFAARTLRAHARLGTHLHVIDGWEGEREAADVARQLTVRDGVAPSLIPMGGSSPLGTLGYVNAALELWDQAAPNPAVQAGPFAFTMRGSDAARPDVVYVAAGTLGTAVGLAVGFALAGAPTRVIAVRVTPSEVASDAIARTLATQTIGLLRELDSSVPELTCAELRFELHDGWFEPGYGVVTPETTDAVELASAAELELETTYTGKAFAALVADARANLLTGEQVLFWDTYSSTPMPPAGPDEALPPVLREYVAECDRLFG